MAIRKKDEAILRKVENILENSQNRRNMYITVHESFDEITTINYNVTEYVIPDEDIREADGETA